MLGTGNPVIGYLPFWVGFGISSFGGFDFAQDSSEDLFEDFLIIPILLRILLGICSRGFICSGFVRRFLLSYRVCSELFKRCVRGFDLSRRKPSGVFGNSDIITCSTINYLALRQQGIFAMFVKSIRWGSPDVVVPRLLQVSFYKAAGFRNLATDLWKLQSLRGLECPQFQQKPMEVTVFCRFRVSEI